VPSIFLSPSTQDWNPYLTTGNEQYWMNRIADAMEPYLRASGIDFTRNDPDRPLSQAIADSNAGNYDLHLALHSNAAPESLAGQLRGADFYYRQGSYWGRRAAEILAEQYRQIYPNPSLVRALPNTTFAELRQTRAPAVLAELAYHDNLEDEAFIMNNVEAIARNLVQGLTIYFGIPFVEPMPPRQGVVITEYTPLMLRDRPSLTGNILARIPRGSEVTVTGQVGDWYVTTYGGQTGYASRRYIRLI